MLLPNTGQVPHKWNMLTTIKNKKNIVIKLYGKGWFQVSAQIKNASNYMYGSTWQNHFCPYPSLKKLELSECKFCRLCGKP